MLCSISVRLWSRRPLTESLSATASLTAEASKGTGLFPVSKVSGSTDVAMEHLAEHLNPDSEFKRLREKIEAVQRRIAERPEGVSDGEIASVLDDLIELEGLPLSDNADLFIRHLSFTRTPLDGDVQVAFKHYLDIAGLTVIDFYPLLLSIGAWYAAKADDAGMARRALAVYEYLLAVVQNRAARGLDENDGIADFVPTMVALYAQDERDLGRARFLFQLLELESRAGRIVPQEFERLVDPLRDALRERSTLTPSYIEQREHTDLLFKILWATLSERELRLLRQADELARRESASYPKEATDRLRDEFGSVWEKLDPDSQQDLVLADTFASSPYVDYNPSVVPRALWWAIQNELFRKIIAPANEPCLFGIVDRFGGAVQLLQRFAKSQTTLTSEERNLLKRALGGRKLTKRDDLRVLYGIQRDRNRAEHREGKPRYTVQDAKNLSDEVWTRKWLVSYFERIHHS